MVQLSIRDDVALVECFYLTFVFANGTAVPVVSDETCLRATPSQSHIGIVVFNGTCSRLGCISGNDEDRHRQGKSWRALPGVQYG